MRRWGGERGGEGGGRGVRQVYPHRFISSLGKNRTEVHKVVQLAIAPLIDYLIAH